MKVASEIYIALSQRGYELGGCSEEGPIDCFGLVHEFIRLHYGLKLSKSFLGHTPETYVDLFKADPNYAMVLLLKYVKEYMTKITSLPRQDGDIVFFTCPGEEKKAGCIRTGVIHINIGIYRLGSYLMVCNEKNGVHLVSKDVWTLTDAFRL